MIASSFAGVIDNVNVVVLPSPVNVSNTLLEEPVPTAVQAVPL